MKRHLFIFFLLPLLASCNLNGNNKKQEIGVYKHNGYNLYYQILSKKECSIYETGELGESVEIPNEIIHKGKKYTVTEIDDYSFAFNSNLKYVKISNSIKRIGEYAFAYCENLDSINIPENIEQLSTSFVFENKYMRYNMYDNGFYLGNDKNPYQVFAKAKHTGIYSCVVNENTEFILNGAFSWCTSLTSLNIPDNSVKVIGDNFLANTNLILSKYPKGVEYLGKGALSYLDKENCDIPSTVKRIEEDDYVNKFRCLVYDNARYLGDEENPFTVLVSSKSSDITSCNIHKNTKIILNGAFSMCTKLESITIPNSVVQIQSKAFDSCSSLKKVVLSNNLEKIETDIFLNCYELQGNLYNNAIYLESDSNPYFYLVKANDKNITSCKINDSTKYVGINAFKDCINLKKVSMSDSVIKMGKDCFKGCELLRNINLSNNLEKIEEGIFEGCKSLRDIFIPNSVNEIGPYAFKNCKSLVNLAIPHNVNKIKTCIVDGDFALKNVYISIGVNCISEKAFYHVSYRNINGITTNEGLCIYCECSSPGGNWSMDWDMVDQVYGYKISCYVKWSYSSRKFY